MMISAEWVLKVLSIQEFATAPGRNIRIEWMHSTVVDMLAGK